MWLEGAWQVRRAQRSLVVSVWLWMAMVALGLTRPPVAGVAGFDIDDAVAWLVFLTVAGVGTLIVTAGPATWAAGCC